MFVLKKLGTLEDVTKLDLFVNQERNNPDTCMNMAMMFHTHHSISMCF